MREQDRWGSEREKRREIAQLYRALAEHARGTRAQIEFERSAMLYEALANTGARMHKP